MHALHVATRARGIGMAGNSLQMRNPMQASRAVLVLNIVKQTSSVSSNVPQADSGRLHQMEQCSLFGVRGLSPVNFTFKLVLDRWRTLDGPDINPRALRFAN